MFGVFNMFMSGVVNTMLAGLDPATIPNLATQYLAKTDLGNVSGLLARLRAAGLDQEVDSWLGSGPNLPVTAEQVSDALGEDVMAQFASATGVSASMLASLMAQYLPQTIDRMSPNGQIEEAPPATPEGSDGTAAG